MKRRGVVVVVVVVVICFLFPLSSCAVMQLLLEGYALIRYIFKNIKKGLPIFVEVVCSRHFHGGIFDIENQYE